VLGGIAGTSQEVAECSDRHPAAPEFGGHPGFVHDLFADGPLDLVVSAAGILVPQDECERDVGRAAAMIGLPPAPLATTPGAVGAATAAALRRDDAVVWVPRSLAGFRSRSA
jgi:hypothetical protein